jgi:hypothetical protein
MNEFCNGHIQMLIMSTLDVPTYACQTIQSLLTQNPQIYLDSITGTILYSIFLTCVVEPAHDEALI